eukprot:14134963-Alexandrium_andersonii.AAC.1
MDGGAWQPPTLGGAPPHPPLGACPARADRRGVGRAAGGSHPPKACPWGECPHGLHRWCVPRLGRPPQDQGAFGDICPPRAGAPHHLPGQAARLRM